MLFPILTCIFFKQRFGFLINTNLSHYTFSFARISFWFMDLSIKPAPLPSSKEIQFSMLYIGQA